MNKKGDPMNADKVVDALREMIAVMDGQLDPDVVDDLCPNARKTLAEYDAQPAQAAQPSADAEILYQQAMTGGGWSDISVEQYERIRSVYPEYVRIVYSTPIVDAEDAARYRWLTNHCFDESLFNESEDKCEVDSRIDAARAAEGGE